MNRENFDRIYDESDPDDDHRWSWLSFWLAGVFWLIVIPAGVILWQKILGA